MDEGSKTDVPELSRVRETFHSVTRGDDLGMIIYGDAGLVVSCHLFVQTLNNADNLTIYCFPQLGAKNE